MDSTRVRRLRGLSSPAILLGVMAVLLVTDRAVADESSFSRGPYIQLTTATSAYVIWRTEERIDPVVRFGTEREKWTGHAAGDQVRVRRVAPTKEDRNDTGRYLHSGPQGTRQHEAQLIGLQPDTIYFYAIFDGDERLTADDASFRFRTHPQSGDAVDTLFWVVGDSGTGEDRQSAVHQAMLDQTEARGREIDFCLHMGDMAYNDGTDRQFQEKFFEIYEPTLRRAVVWPALGNHEGRSADSQVGTGPYYDAYLCPMEGEAGGVASGNESYYAFDYGSIHFVVLNSFDVDRTSGGAMAGWLREDLSRVNADWLVAYWHHPPYSKGTHDTDVEKDSIEMRSHILPILESHGVDLVLTGHSHIYERSMLMDGAYETPTSVEGVILDDGDGDPEGDGPYRKLPGLTPRQGTVQLVAGHGGTDVGRMATMPVMKRIVVENGSVLISIRGRELEGVMINHEGEVRDRFQLRKEPGVVAERIQNPATLPPYVPPGDPLPAERLEIISQGAEWAYFMDAAAGKTGAEADREEGGPPEDWTGLDFEDGSWPRGRAGFGYGDGDDETFLPGLRDAGDRLFIRRQFDLDEETNRKQLGLGIRYDDGFIVYLNGKEIFRHGVGAGSGGTARDVVDRDAGKDFEYFPLPEAAKHLRSGRNVIALEGHSIERGEPDFTLDPFLIEEFDVNHVDGEAPPLVLRSVVPVGEWWRYSLGQAFEEGWETPEFDDSGWGRGRSPLGYGDKVEVLTSLEVMKDRMTRARFRREFEMGEDDPIDLMGLLIGWDDGFVAYLNGTEIGRGGVARGSGPHARGFGKTGLPAARFFPFSEMKDLLRPGRNVVAIEGHNQAMDSSDYFMAPSIERQWPVTWKRPEKDLEEKIPFGAKWEVLAGSDPVGDWTLGHADEGGDVAEGRGDWEEKRAPFGFGYRGMETVLEGMRGNYQRVYLRKAFEVGSLDEPRGIPGLVMAWDDAFIAYLNGREVLRVGVDQGRAASVSGMYSVGNARFVHFPLAEARGLLREGKNWLAIEAHNFSPENGDFVIEASLVESPAVEGKPVPMPAERTPIIPPGALWRYLVEGSPPEGWKGLSFDASAWPLGRAGFGYGDEDDQTVVEMKDRSAALYVRRVFELKESTVLENLALGMRWDDAFIAYLNGHEIIRQNVKTGAGSEARGIDSVESRKEHVGFRLAPYVSHLRHGWNVIAIEGHNTRMDSSDFTLDPILFEAGWPAE